MRTKDAREIRAAIMRARECGWRNPPTMRMDRQLGLTYINPLEGEAWRRTMKRMGQEFPKPPTGPSGIGGLAPVRRNVAAPHE